MNNKTLNLFRQYLDEYQFPYVCEEATKTLPFERIIVDLGNDSQGQKRRLLIRLIDYPLSSKEEDAEQAIQFLYAFPFRFRETAAAELARLLAFYNNSFELPGLGMEEHNHSIYFRYSFLKPNGFMKKRTFIAFIGAILLTIDTLSDTIKNVAEGKSMKQELMDTVKLFTAA